VVRPGQEPPPPISADDLVDPAVELVQRWLHDAAEVERPRDRRSARRLRDVVADPDSRSFTMRFVDRVLRHRDDRLAAAELAALVRDTALPSYLSAIDRLLLRTGARLAPTAPWLVMPLARRRMRRLVGPLVLDADRDRLHAHLDAKRSDGFGMNVNLLGEMVLGDGEAARRFERTLALVDDPSVHHVSVKLSSIVAQLDLWSYEVTLDRVVDRLRALLERAAGTVPPTFVNLDMEEYRDLELTVQAFTRALDEPSLERLDAGIVLQAYLPDSYAALQRLVDWAHERHRRSGGTIKIRIVKGANLAMEQVDAELHGWSQAPYASKHDTDANYKRCLDWVLTPDRTAAVRVGVASHNLFDLAWGHLLAEARGMADRVRIEMLQGVAPAQAEVVLDRTGDVVLYTPIVDTRDFDAAIAYLFRRLDESSAPENFLRHLVGLEPGSREFVEQAERFRSAVRDRWATDTEPRRLTARVREPDPAEGTGAFRNEPDSDPSLVPTRVWIDELRRSSPAPTAAPVTAHVDEVDAAFAGARRAQHAWWALGATARRTVLMRVADELARRRGELLVTMAHEARKTFAEADPEVSEAIDFARWYADRGCELDLEHATFRPLGAIAVVPPWNFPVAIPAGGVLAALAAGNGVVLKPSTETPRCAEVVAEACWAAGVPPELLHVVRTPDDHVGRHLVTTADGVILTGSWETARMFRSWRPDMHLVAETSGKNALVVTPHADLDLAAVDVVHSAFGHSGQKCSAASLLILVGGLYDDERFRSKLVDATRSLRVGEATEPGTTFGPLIAPASEPLLGGLTRLDPGERWLLEPCRLDDDGSRWTPGIRTGVEPGSAFHQTEYFGPVLGVMRARDLDEAVELQNAVPFGLTGGIHTLDEHEVARWLDAVEVGNAYVNRRITGAIVQRQPFGGWKRSSVGPGAKAGGTDYLMQLGTWEPSSMPDSAMLAAAERSDAQWWTHRYGIEIDDAGLTCEANVTRYRPRPDVLVRVRDDASRACAQRVLAAARRTGAGVVVSCESDGLVESPDVVEDDAVFAIRLSSHRWGLVRLIGSRPPGLREAAVDAEVELVEAPVTANGRLELRWFLREQSVSRTMHRFGSPIAGPAIPRAR
jgi:RHH-type proline utilization regulon transcriptional repressor/proline dehydrogenase/delta 1-pyrroline-5-carboxylate dehydrogenase